MELLSNYSSLLEIAAAVNIAFVAVEYSKSYTQTLSEKVFDFPNIINRAFQPCNKVIFQKDTLNEMQPIILGEKTTFVQIQQSLIDIEKLEEEIESKRKKMNEKMLLVCNYAHFPSLSLWNFLFSIVLLFVSGYEYVDSDFSIIFVLLISLFTFLFQLFGWIVNDENKQSTPYCLSNSILVFIGVILFSIIIAFFTKSYATILNETFLIGNWIYFITLLPFINFVVFFYFVRRKIKKLKKWIVTESDESVKKSEAIQKTIDELTAVISISRKLSI